MKDRMFRNLFVILAILLISSCSLSESVKAGSIAVSGGEIISRTAVEIDEDAKLKMVFTLSGGMNESREAEGTLSELMKTTFTFEEIPVGTRVNVVCSIIYYDDTEGEIEIFRATGNDIVIQAGHNEVKLKMQNVLEDTQEPEPNEPEPVEPEPVEPDPTEPNPVEPDPVEPDPIDPDPTPKPDPIEPDPEPEPEPDPIKSSISITLPSLDSETDISVSVNKTAKKLEAASGYTSYKWLLNGVERGIGDALDISSLPYGVYQVFIIADGIYSARFELIWEE